jgi:outer membrane protein TolC
VKRAMVRFRVGTFALLLTLSARPSRAQSTDDALPAQLSLDEAVRLLQTRGLDLLIADASIDAAAADVKTAGAITNPEVSFGVGRSFTYDPTRCAGCSEIGWSAGLSDQGGIADSVFGRRRLRIELANATLAAAHHGRADVLRLGEFAVRQQYVAVARAEAELDLAREEKTVWEGLLELTRVRYRAGAISEGDVAKAETAALTAAQDVSSAGQALTTAKATLAYLLGVRGGVTEFDVDKTVLARAPSRVLATMSTTRLLELARQSRPDLKAATAQVSAAEGALAVARRQRAPGVALSLQAAGQGTGQNALLPPTLTFGVAVTPPLLYQYQGEIGRAEAVLHEQQLGLSKVESQVASEIDIARASYAATSERVVRARGPLLSSALRARDIVRVQYQKGAASFLELLDAQRTLLDVQRDSVAQAADHAVAFFQVQQAVGKEPPL